MYNQKVYKFLKTYINAKNEIKYILQNSFQNKILTSKDIQKIINLIDCIIFYYGKVKNIKEFNQKFFKIKKINKNEAFILNELLKLYRLRNYLKKEVKHNIYMNMKIFQEIYIPILYTYRNIKHFKKYMIEKEIF